MIRVLDSAGSTLVEWGRQQQQPCLVFDVSDDHVWCLMSLMTMFGVGCQWRLCLVLGFSDDHVWCWVSVMTMFGV